LNPETLKAMKDAAEKARQMYESYCKGEIEWQVYGTARAKFEHLATFTSVLGLIAEVERQAGEIEQCTWTRRMDDMANFYYQSTCGMSRHDAPHRFNYCPNCGKRMDYQRTVTKTAAEC
jgi:hypothetical protein